MAWTNNAIERHDTEIELDIFDQTKRIFGKDMLPGHLFWKNKTACWFGLPARCQSNKICITMTAYQGWSWRFSISGSIHILAYKWKETNKVIAFPYGIRIVSISEWGEIRRSHETDLKPHQG